MLAKEVLEGDPRGVMVRKSFLTSSISNALDSTEDNAIYEEEPDIHTEENEMDEEFDTESEDEPLKLTSLIKKNQTASLGTTTY